MLFYAGDRKFFQSPMQLWLNQLERSTEIRKYNSNFILQGSITVATAGLQFDWIIFYQKVKSLNNT